MGVSSAVTSANCIWAPSTERVRCSNAYNFIRYLSAKGVDVKDFWGLLDWSVDCSQQFWAEVWEHYRISGQRVGPTLASADSVEEARWFPESKLNFSENLLRHQSDKVALVEIDADGSRFELSYSELRSQVQSVAHYLRGQGVEPGDVVAGVMDNSIQTVVACLAAAQVGAVWTACSLDFGADAVVERLGQVSPKVLFTVAPFHGKKALMTDVKLEAMCRRMPSIREVIICKGDAAEASTVLAVHVVNYDDILNSPRETNYEQFPFNHLLYVLYSSGTTGTPKCIMHGAGGTLLQHIKELGLHVGLKDQDTILYYTSCGWMMWNWLISSLFFGATIVLYGGSPIFPSARRLFDVSKAEGVTVLGVNPRYLQACFKSSVKYDVQDGLPDLRTLLSTGSILQPYLYDYIYENIKADVLVSSISGGSDIVSCFVLGSEMLPVHRGESQTLGLGMDVAAMGDDGQRLQTGRGELVCCNPFPSRPLGFWGDEDGRRFHRAYFDRFPNVWTHGDYIEMTQHRGIVFHGRSDASLNVGGIRVGTGEIYRQLEKVPDVVEALAVEQSWKGDSRMLLFLRLANGSDLTRELQREVRRLIRENLSENHVPNKIVAVPELPRTFSGKNSELAVKAIVNGQPVENIAALENPEALDFFKNMQDILQ